MVAFLKGLHDGALISNETLNRMHDWRQLENMPFQYGFGTMYFSPAPLRAVMRVPYVGTPDTWGHTGSLGSFLYYSEDLDLYMAGSIDQTENNAAPIMLMIRVMLAVQQLR